MSILLWVCVPVVLVVGYALIVTRQPSDFPELTRRERAMDKVAGWNLTPHYREKDSSHG